MLPIKPVEPVPPYEAGPMPPRTPALALFGFGAVAAGIGQLEVLPVLALGWLIAPVGIVCGLVAIALGALALGKIARLPARYEGRPMAIAALALGVLEALVYAGVLAFEAAGLHL
jgi:hypothetical protein